MEVLAILIEISTCHITNRIKSSSVICAEQVKFSVTGDFCVDFFERSCSSSSRHLALVLLMMLCCWSVGEGKVLELSTAAVNEIKIIMMSFHTFVLVFGLIIPNLASNQFLMGFDDAIPNNAVEELLKEIGMINDWRSIKNDDLLHGKGRTFWLPAQNMKEPRFWIEWAVAHLQKYACAKMELTSCADELAGAEWWFQTKPSDIGIGFHYDKDEALASIHGRMRHPLLSTVTYLTNSGGPTLVFDMITPDGNSNIPPIPENGFVSFPKSGRHIVFRLANSLSSSR